MVALSRHIAEYFESGPVSQESLDIAREYLDEVRNRGVRYEGAIKLETRLKRLALHRALPHIARAAVLEVKRQCDRDVRCDNHLDGYLVPALIEGFLQPWRAWRFRRRNAQHFLGADDLAKAARFAFFPLHFEPEVSIQVFGRPYQNQIEVVRALALSLPADVQLVVKEHPRAIGFRPSAYYDKLLDIPNVRFAEPLLPSISVVRHASLVAVIAGTIGLEAAILGKPVLAFGRPSYCVLPDEVIAKVTDLWRLPCQIRELLDREAAPDIEPVVRFLAANVEGSVPVDLYSALLGKTGRHHDVHAGTMAEHQAKQLRRLADYARDRLFSGAGPVVPSVIEAAPAL